MVDKDSLSRKAMVDKDISHADWMFSGFTQSLQETSRTVPEQVNTASFTILSNLTFINN
jgi:hypothetical protein